MFLHEIGVVHRAPVGLFHGALAQQLDAVVAQRVVVEELVAASLFEHLLVAEVVEEIDEALGRLAALLQVGDRRLVGAGLLLARVADGAERAEVLRGAEQAAPASPAPAAAAMTPSSSVSSMGAMPAFCISPTRALW